MTYRSTFLQALDARGFIPQVTDAAALDAAAEKGVVTAYVGYDCTAPSLHIGNLVSIMMLRHLQQAGHRPIVLMGGGTTKVGDPSGKAGSCSTMRGSLPTRRASSAFSNAFCRSTMAPRARS